MTTGIFEWDVLIKSAEALKASALQAIDKAQQTNDSHLFRLALDTYHAVSIISEYLQEGQP